jgi:hypothetical protein
VGSSLRQDEDLTPTHGYEPTRGRHAGVCLKLAQGMKRARAHLNPPIRRRALVLLFSCPEGCTKAILTAHNIPEDIVERLIHAGLAVACTEGGISRVRITDAGKQHLTSGA